MQDMELLEGEDFGEPFLGDLIKGAGSLLGLGEGEEEVPLGESEDEQFLGGLLKGVGGMLGLGEGEEEGGLYEDEQFFGAFRKIASRVLPIVKKVAQTAAPMVARAVGGPLGGPIGSIVAGALREDEDFGEGFDMEDFGEGFDQEDEALFETVLEAPMNETQAIGEMMAAVAANAATDTEAEAQIGGAIAISLTPEERRALRDFLPAITRGAAVLTRVLRRHPATRRAVPAVVPIVKRTAIVLKNKADQGRPVTKSVAAKTMARQTRKVLGTPSVCAKAIQRNATATRAAVRRNQNRTRQSYAW